MLAPRRWLGRSAVAGLMSCVLGCFTDAPPLDEDTGSTSAADTSAAAEADATGSPTTASADEATGSPDDSGSSGADTTAATANDVASESDTGQPACECPSSAALCDGFEDGLELWSPGAGKPPPSITSDVVQCGNGALHTEVSGAASHATISAVLIGPEPLQSAYSFGGWYSLASTCAQPTPVRFLRLYFDDGGGETPEYLVDVVLDPGALRLRATGPEFDSEVTGTLMQVETDAWVEFRIDIDLTDSLAPQVSATIGSGSVAIDAPPAVPTFAELRVYPTLGPYREGKSQSDELCVIVYDQVWFGPTP